GRAVAAGAGTVARSAAGEPGIGAVVGAGGWTMGGIAAGRPARGYRGRTRVGQTCRPDRGTDRADRGTSIPGTAGRIVDAGVVPVWASGRCAGGIHTAGRPVA